MHAGYITMKVFVLTIRSSRNGDVVTKRRSWVLV